MKVSEAAERYIVLSRPDYHGPLSFDGADYMREPADMVRSRSTEAVIFAGPAQSVKTTALVEGAVAHAITCDPIDTLVVQMTQQAARDWSQNRLGPLVRNSPSLKGRLSFMKSEDNTFDKRFSGMLLRVGWPAPSELSSKSVPLVIMTDYDRYPPNIGGEGPAFFLATARIRSFGSLGTVVAESSPKAVYEGNWQPQGHAAPPVETGILSLYNRGDRRRLFWQCPECGDGFEPSFARLSWPTTAADGAELGFKDQAAAINDGTPVVMVCPHCGSVIGERQKPGLNARCLWVPEGEVYDADLIGLGYAPKSPVVSYWMFGPAAKYQGWSQLARRWCELKDEEQRTGNDEGLMGFVNLDLGDCHIRRPVEDKDALDPVAIQARAEPHWKLGTIPDGVRALVATVDVQGRYFDVQITGMGPQFESWVVDRWQIAHAATDRLVDPGAYLEDWDLLTSILDRTWPFANDPDRRMRVMTMGVDSGGAQGVTGNAYFWANALRDDGVSEDRLILLKGDARVGNRKVAVDRVDFMRDGTIIAKGRKILKVGTDSVKTDVAASLRRSEPGPGYVHTPHDLVDEWYLQVTAEKPDAKGCWEKIRPGIRNEAFDHMVYARALVLRPPFSWDRINWDQPPAWAQTSVFNSLARLASDSPDAGGSALPVLPPSPSRSAQSPPRPNWLGNRTGWLQRN